jgi:hypothetical protein
MYIIGEGSQARKGPSTGSSLTHIKQTHTIAPCMRNTLLIVAFNISIGLPNCLCPSDFLYRILWTFLCALLSDKRQFSSSQIWLTSCSSLLHYFRQRPAVSLSPGTLRKPISMSATAPFGKH